MWPGLWGHVITPAVYGPPGPPRHSMPHFPFCCEWQFSELQNSCRSYTDFKDRPAHLPNLGGRKEEGVGLASHECTHLIFTLWLARQQVRGSLTLNTARQPYTTLCTSNGMLWAPVRNLTVMEKNTYMVKSGWWGCEDGKKLTVCSWKKRGSCWEKFCKARSWWHFTNVHILCEHLVRGALPSDCITHVSWRFEESFAKWDIVSFISQYGKFM